MLWLPLLLGPAMMGTPSLGTSRSVVAQGSSTAGYQHVDTWSEAAWSLTAGRYARAADLTTTADGRTHIVDLGHAAVHTLAADGTPLHITRPSDAARWRPQRIDARERDRWLLSQSLGTLGQPISRLSRLDAVGQTLASLDFDIEYRDLAVAPNGELHLITSSPPARVEVFSPELRRLRSYGEATLRLPAAIDIADDGTVFVLNKHPLPAPPTPGPGPRPTREPAEGIIRVQDKVFQTDQASDDAEEGVFEFDAESEMLIKVWPLTGGRDLAVRDADRVYVSRDLEVLRLDQPEPPRFIAPSPGLISTQSGAAPIHLDLRAGEEAPPVASLWHCYFQGLVDLAVDPGRSDPDAPFVASYFGNLDRPPLEGPVLPERIAFGNELAILQGRFSIQGAGDSRSFHPSPIAAESEPQSVQVWTGQGELRDQLGVCAGHPNAYTSAWARDVAADGARTFHLDPSFIRSRKTSDFPEWSYWADESAPPESSAYLTSMDADGGRVAFVDAGLGRVGVLNARGDLIKDIPLEAFAAEGEARVLPSDLALSGSWLFLAETGRSRIQVYDLSASEIRQAWSLQDRPLRIAASASGRVLVLGESGLGYRFDAEGRLEATWWMPEPGPRPLDITVDQQGRVFVSFAEEGMADSPRGNSEEAILRAGVWVFEPSEGDAPDAPPSDRCHVLVDKRAEPTRLQLGELVQVTLELNGACPYTQETVSAAIVLDRSRSMGWEAALERARTTILDSLARLDPSRVALSLISFSDEARLEVPMGHDHAAIAQALSRQSAGGDTRAGAAIELAIESLNDADSTTRPQLITLSDGGFTDEPAALTQGLRDAGVVLDALIYRTDDFPGRSIAAALTGGDRSRIILDPDPLALAALIDGAAERRLPDFLFQQLTVVDRIPANMRYVEQSAEPEAEYDPVAGTLTWRLYEVERDAPPTLRFLLEPLEAGRWPTNVEAVATYDDGLWQPGRSVFPIPSVRVIGPELRPVYLPLLLRGDCVSAPSPTDLLFVVDTSESMAAPARSDRPGDGRKLDIATRAMAAMFGELDLSLHRVGMLRFSDEASLLQGFTRDRAALEDVLEVLQTSPGTRIDRGLRLARETLAASNRGASAETLVILITDGRQAGPSSEVELEAEALRAGGARLASLGLGEDVDRALLERIGSRVFTGASTADEILLGLRRLIQLELCERERSSQP